MIPILRITLLLLLFLTALPVTAQTPEQKGLEIAREADRRDSGFRDWSANAAMVLRDKSGRESRREMRVRVLEQAQDGDKSLIVFDSPPDIRRTALLTFSHKKGEDEQWIFLPEVSRVKRISGASRSGPFVGSEFAYEDLVSDEVEKYTYRWLRDEPCGPATCSVVERYPTDRHSGYSKQIVWRDNAEYRIQKIEFYDRKSSLLKTLVAEGYRKYAGRFWRPDRGTMQNHQSGKSTVLLWSGYAFGTGLRDAEFSRNALSRAE